MDQDLDQILLVIGGVLGGAFLLVFLLAWMEPGRPATDSAVRRPSARLRLAALLGALAPPEPARAVANVSLPLSAESTTTTAAGSATQVS